LKITVDGHRTVTITHPCETQNTFKWMRLCGGVLGMVRLLLKSSHIHFS